MAGPGCCSAPTRDSSPGPQSTSPEHRSPSRRYNGATARVSVPARWQPWLPPVSFANSIGGVTRQMRPSGEHVHRPVARDVHHRQRPLVERLGQFLVNQLGAQLDASGVVPVDRVGTRRGSVATGQHVLLGRGSASGPQRSREVVTPKHPQPKTQPFSYQKFDKMEVRTSDGTPDRVGLPTQYKSRCTQPRVAPAGRRTGGDSPIPIGGSQQPGILPAELFHANPER